MSETILQELAEQIGHRITVFWSCNGAIACSTGTLTEVGQDFVEVYGLAPTFREGDGHFPCRDPRDLELETIIPLKSICAYVEDVPCNRKAALPICCGVLDPPKPGSNPTDPQSDPENLPENEERFIRPPSERA